MTGGVHSHSNSEEQALPEQEFVTHAYERLDSLRESYRLKQRRAHATHGVNNAQAWTERDAISSHLGDMAARLEGVEERLVFGRLDLEDHTVRHIGRIALSTPDSEPLLIDWRAPAALPFYQATALNPLDVVRRRHITTKNRRVTALEDELLNSEAAHASDLELHGEGALMSALNEARDGRMGDIVATIQAEQDRIIRASERSLIVVQGGPGTGKTAVALHRIAYLLYTQRERLQRSGVLLIGPSRIFLRYVEQVLPSLGETGVVSMTLGDLIPGIRTSLIESERVGDIKGRSSWSRLLKEAVRQLVRIPQGDQQLRVWNRDVTLRRQDVEHAQRRARRSGKPHNLARDGFALELMDVLAHSLAVAAGDVDSEGQPTPDGTKAWLSEVRDSIDARRAINLAWMPTSAQTLLARLYSNPHLLERANTAAGSPLTHAERELLVRPKKAPWTVSDIPLLDELEELLGPLPHAASSQRNDSATREAVERAQTAIENQGLGGGIVTAQMLAHSTLEEPDWTPLAEKAAADRSWTYGHIVVDEAQDLSAMAWKALLRRCPSRSFTIVGDLDQRRGHHRPKTWSEALGPAKRAFETEYALTVSYRTPVTLTKLAESVMARLGEPVTYPMTAVRDIEDCYRTVFVPASTSVSSEANEKNMPGRSQDPQWSACRDAIERASKRLDEESGKGTGRIGVIVSNERALAWQADTYGDSALNQRVSVLSAAASKGLEFDSVILVEPSEIAQDGFGDLFVALTRATHDLTVIHSLALPPGMEEWAN